MGFRLTWYLVDITAPHISSPTMNCSPKMASIKFSQHREESPFFRRIIHFPPLLFASSYVIVVRVLFHETNSVQINYYLATDRKGKVMFSQVFVCPQSASWPLVHCSALLRLGRYASYWNAFLFL